MNRYLITYDLKNKNLRSYENLFVAIKSVGPWWHHLESTWIVKSPLTAEQIWRRLGPFLQTNDLILVIKIDASDKWGWLPPDAWAWLNS